MTNWWQKLRLDPFLVIMITVVILASLFPATGNIATGFRYLTTAAIALLFFFHGAKLSRDACKRDLRLLLLGRDKLSVPLIIGSCGTR